MEEHLDQVSDLIQKLSSELRSGLRPAYESFMGFFLAVDRKEPPWLVLVVVILSRKHINFKLYLFLCALSGVFFSERLNRVLSENWRCFASRNYFDPSGIFLSVLWSGPLLFIAITILPLLLVLPDCQVEKGRTKTSRQASPQAGLIFFTFRSKLSPSFLHYSDIPSTRAYRHSSARNCFGLKWC